MVDPEIHPLDEPLGMIHEVAIMLQYLSVRHPDPATGEALHQFARGLAIAHAKIQKYALQATSGLEADEGRVN